MLGGQHLRVLPPNQEFSKLLALPLPSPLLPEATSISGSHCGSGASYYYKYRPFFAKKKQK